MEGLNVRVGRAVSTLREHSKLSQTALARNVGVSQAAISQIECGRRINNLDTLERIALAFGLTLSEMLKLAAVDTAKKRILIRESEDAIREAEKQGWIPLDEVQSRLKTTSRKK